MPGAAGASVTRRFKKLSVMGNVVREGERRLRTRKKCSPGAGRQFRRQAKEISWVDLIH